MTYISCDWLLGLKFGAFETYDIILPCD